MSTTVLYVIICILSLLLILSVYWNIKEYLNYKRRLKPNWEILENRLVNIGLAIVGNSGESRKIQEQLETLQKEIVEIKNQISNKAKDHDGEMNG